MYQKCIPNLRRTSRYLNRIAPQPLRQTKQNGLSSSFQSSSRFVAVRSFSSTPSVETSTAKEPVVAGEEVETREFRAETKQLLDIVTHSIYTDKEVFVRELISNASDALEKLRYLQVQGNVTLSDEPLEIKITADKAAKTLVIEDNGIGMTRGELTDNLGIIARSGSRQFVQELASGADPHGIIGQFGVGFYSSFMVADSVVVESTHATAPDTTGHRWASDGTGQFTIEKCGPGVGVKRGTRVTLRLKPKQLEFAEEGVLKGIIKKYSNFVKFSIRINGAHANTVAALWTKDKKDVSESEYAEFYKFVSNAFDPPRVTLHFRTDAPIDLKCLLFVPSFHGEKFGQGRMEPGVNLYSKKVLIESKSKDLLPDWLRFMKGVIDSEDLPLSLSREKPQDSALLRRIKDVVTRKLVRFFEEQLRDHRDSYREFHMEYAHFLKEGVCSDQRFAEPVSKLLMFESSALPVGTVTTLDEYISRCGPEQKDIYYLVAPSRDAALTSPYMEAFKGNGREVLFMYNHIDDFVMSSLKTYANRPLTSAESKNVDQDESKSSSSTTNENKDDKNDNTDKDTKNKKSTLKSGPSLNDIEARHLCDWLKQALGSQKVNDVKLTSRLNDSPAIVTDHESGALRRMVHLVTHQAAPALPPQALEINPRHPIILSLYKLVEHVKLNTTTTASAPKSTTAPDSSDGIAEAEILSSSSGESTPATSLATQTALAQIVAEQVYDNALIAAGLVDDPRHMLSRLNKILQAAVEKK